ncbi:MAG: RNA methyltransferase [Acidobacteria bacterium]|nr:RNA methyltransferase [Acidobacteriota bacterium]
MSVLTPETCRIVLVRARNPLNIGAAARAMKNFGFTDLVLVGIHPPIWEEARSAVGACDILAQVRVVPSIAEAVQDCSLVAGTTTGRRHPHETEYLTPADFIDQLGAGTSRGRTAIVFGSEKTGLNREELSHCRHRLRIPTATDAPSMNLGQAVAVCCYEFARRGTPPVVRANGGSEPASLGVMEGLVQDLTWLFQQSGFFPPSRLRVMVPKLRRTLLRLELSHQEASFFRGATQQMVQFFGRQGK